MQLRNMHKMRKLEYAKNMQVYARPQISSVLQKYARNMKDVCTYVQNMQAGFYMQDMQIYASPT
jgi:hypothetical protein